MDLETKAPERGFSTLTMWRSQESQRAYNEQFKNEQPRVASGQEVSLGIAAAACKFCTLDQSEQEIAPMNDHFFVTNNLFPYSHWDSREVFDHKLLIPARHVIGLKDLTSEEKLAWFDAVGAFEDTGYTTYTRAPECPTKSIDHLHTHLLQITMASRAIRYLHYDSSQGVCEFGYDEDNAREIAS